MYAQKGMTTPAHAHKKKKEDIICRWGKLAVQVWAGEPAKNADKTLSIPVNHEEQEVCSGAIIEVEALIASDTGSGYLSRVQSCFRRMHHWRGLTMAPTTTCTITFSSTQTLGAILASRKTRRRSCA